MRSFGVGGRKQTLRFPAMHPDKNYGRYHAGTCIRVLAGALPHVHLSFIEEHVCFLRMLSFRLPNKMDEIRKIPPVTRTILLTTIGLTVPMLLGLLSPHRFVLIWPAVLRRWQVWRPITAFFFGGQGLQLLFDCFLLLYVQLS